MRIMTTTRMTSEFCVAHSFIDFVLLSFAFFIRTAAHFIYIDMIYQG